jgi:RHS repeat-associated protein
VVRYDYTAFGVATVVYGPDATGNTILFAGRELDPTTGLYYNRARWYDPSKGVFITRDPLGYAGGDANLYRYCGNNPICRANHSGTAAPGSDGGWGIGDSAMNIFDGRTVVTNTSSSRKPVLPPPAPPPIDPENPWGNPDGEENPFNPGHHWYDPPTWWPKWVPWPFDPPGYQRPSNRLPQPWPFPIPIPDSSVSFLCSASGIVNTSSSRKPVLPPPAPPPIDPQDPWGNPDEEENPFSDGHHWYDPPTWWPKWVPWPFDPPGYHRPSNRLPQPWPFPIPIPDSSASSVCSASGTAWALQHDMSQQIASCQNAILSITYVIAWV